MRRMAPHNPPRPRVFVDADVLFAGSAAPSQSDASLVVLRLAEITLIEAVTSLQAVTEAERNLQLKLPHALPAFRLLVSRCLRVIPDPALLELQAHTGRADPKDLPILVAALQAGCPWLVTFNLSDFRPGHPAVTVLKPGDFVLRIRELLTHLTFDD